MDKNNPHCILEAEYDYNRGTTLSVDIETYSSADIAKCGMYRYVEDDDFKILLIAYAFDDEPPEICDIAHGESLPPEVTAALVSPKVTKYAYNAVFEWYCLSKMLFGEPDYDRLAQWRCTMIQGAYCGYPLGLAAAGAALGIPEDKAKMAVGRALIRRFCTPKGAEEPFDAEKWELFKAYCKRDVEAERAIQQKLKTFPLPEYERRSWELDCKINARGVALDSELINHAVREAGRISTAALGENLPVNPRSTVKLKEYLGVADVTKETVEKLLSDPNLSADKRKVLETRREISRAAVSKYRVMRDVMCADGRARGLLQFYGSRTGRWAGRHIQPQNMPRGSVPAAELDVLRERLKRGEGGFTNEMLSSLVRTAIVAPRGKTLCDADFSAIEARVVAWLSGESWRLEVFKTHGKIYEASASSMFGVPLSKIVKGEPEYAYRAKGKVAELALGYAGGVAALKSMGADKMGLSDAELSDIVKRWRAANPNVCRLWYSYERAAMSCLKYGGAVVAGKVTFRREGDFLTVQLPSGRKLFYPEIHPARDCFNRPTLAYRSANAWREEFTYGGKLCENIVQAVARDILAEALVRLEERGFKVVLHVHDEILVETDGDKLDEIIYIMKETPAWAEGLPLNADGYAGQYFRKD